MMNEVMVSVFCLAYNHEKYIRKALDGFVNQITDFKFEVLIHDDASTDNTAQIIKEYAEKYPEIIKPVFQTENQYSKGKKITREYLLPMARGKYFAWCEGDDCWTNNNKLQKQVDYLETHPDYSYCCHRVLCKNFFDGSERFIPNIEESRDYELDEIVRKGAVFQLSSLVFRSDLYRKKPDCFSTNGFGDIQLYMYGAMFGKCYVLSDVMSQYNHGTEGSWTNRISKNREKNVVHEKQMLEMLKRVNEYYDYKYNDSLAYAISRAEFNIHILTGNMKKAKMAVYREFYKNYKRRKQVFFVKKYFPIIVNFRRAIKSYVGSSRHS